MSKLCALRNKLRSLTSTLRVITSLKNAGFIKYSQWNVKASWSCKRLEESGRHLQPLDLSSPIQILLVGKKANNKYDLSALDKAYPQLFKKFTIWGTEPDLQYPTYEGSALNNVVICYYHNATRISVQSFSISKYMLEPINALLLEFIRTHQKATYYYNSYLQFYKATQPCKDFIEEYNLLCLKTRQGVITKNLLEII